MSLYDGATTITRAIVEAVDDAGDGQALSLRGFAGERFTGVLRPQPHGLSTVPPQGSVGVFLRHGSSDRLTAIAFESAGKRPRSLPAGAAALYNADGTVWKLLPAKADLDHGGKHSHERGIGRKKVEASEWFWVAGPVYLGPGPWFPVMTSAGPSTCVFATVGATAPDSPTPNTI